MSVTIAKANKALAKIAEEYDLDISKIQALVAKEIPRPSPWASGKAKNLASKAGIDPYKITGSGNGGKITIDDVREMMGEKVEKKIENLFASKTARVLAEENDLSQEDFSTKEKSGRPRKSGAVTITLEDVRKKAGINSPKKSKSPFASGSAKSYAMENDVKPEKIEGSGKDGKITKADIKKFMSKKSSPKKKVVKEESDSSDSESD